MAGGFSFGLAQVNRSIRIALATNRHYENSHVVSSDYALQSR